MGNHFCRVCGKYYEDPPWGEDGRSPSYIICWCCGVEFGYEDYTLESARAYRKQWIENGTEWWDKKQKPANWDLTLQLKNIPKDFA
jgi:hypothetical protein